MKRSLVIILALIFIISTGIPIMAEQPGNYTVRTGVENNNYITKTITGIKKTIGSGEAIIETDSNGNPTGRAYLANQLIGELDQENIERVEVPGQMKWDKYEKVKPLRVDFWFPNVINGSTLNMDPATRDAVGNRSTSYQIPGPKTLVLNEYSQTWDLIAIVKNPNSFAVKGTINLNLSSLYSTSGTASYMSSKSCTFNPGTSYVNFGSINSWGNGFKGIGYKLNGGNDINEATEPAKYYFGTNIDDIIDPLYPPNLRTAAGKIQGFVPASKGGSPTFAANGEIIYKMLFTCYKRDWYQSYFRQVSGIATWNKESQSWVISLNRPPDFTDNEMLSATRTIPRVFNQWGLNVPTIYSEATYYAGDDWCTFTSLKPPQDGGCTFKEATSVYSEGDIVDSLRTGVLIPYSHFVETNRTRFYAYGKQFYLPSGTYWEKGYGAGTRFRPDGWMSCIPVVRSRPCFVDRFSFVPDSANPDLGYISKTSVIGVVLDDSNIARPYINWNTNLKKIEVVIQDNKNATSSGTCTWTPANGWSYTQKPLDLGWLGVIPVEQFSAAGNWTIKVTYGNTLTAVNPGDTPLNFRSGVYGYYDIETFSFAQPYLTKNQGITDDTTKKCFETLMNEAMTGCDSPVTVTADPVWDTGLYRINMPAGSNNPIGTTEKTITFLKTYSSGNAQCLGDRLQAITEACQAGLRNEEAMFVESSYYPLIELPPLDCSKYGNTFCGNTKSLIGYEEDSSNRYVYEKPYGFTGIMGGWGTYGGTPNFAYSSYIKQPLVVAMDFPPISFFTSTRCSMINPIPWRIYNRSSGEATLPD